MFQVNVIFRRKSIFMREIGRKNKSAYSFLEIFLSLSVLGVLLGIVFSFPVKVLKEISFVQRQQDTFIELYEEVSRYIQKASSITLKDNAVDFRLCLGSKVKILSVAFVNEKREVSRNAIRCYLPGGIRTEWYCWSESSGWEKLLINETRTGSRFLKVIFLNSKHKIVEQFVFSCYAMA